MRRIDELEAVFAEVYAPTVRALTLAFGDPEAAADAVQDAFVQAHRHWRRIHRYDRPDRWIRRVAVNRMLNERRRRGRADALTQRLAALPARGDEWADGPEERMVLVEAIAGLPPGQRLALALHHLADLPVAAVADALGVSEGTVKSQLHDARRALADRLGEVPS